MRIVIPKKINCDELYVLKHLLIASRVSPDCVETGDFECDVVCHDPDCVLVYGYEIKKLLSLLRRNVEVAANRDSATGTVRAKYLVSVDDSAYFNSISNRIRLSCKIQDEPSVVVLSHDVDRISAFDKWLLAKRAKNIIQSLSHFDVRSALNVCKKSWESRKSYNDIYQIMQLEDKYNFRSTFYFLCGQGGRYGARYSLNNVKSLMREMDAAGWEVGLHLNYYSWHDFESIRSEKSQIEDILGHKISGCRVHYLHFDDQTIELLIKAGFKYDASVGFADEIAFRAGIAYPYYYFAAKEENLVEIPITYMDGAGYESKCWTNSECQAKFNSLLSEFGHNAVLSFLWHSGTLSNPDYPGWGDGYKLLLETIKKNNLIVKTHNEVATDFTKRARLYSHIGTI